LLQMGPPGHAKVCLRDRVSHIGEMPSHVICSVHKALPRRVPTFAALPAVPAKLRNLFLILVVL